MAPCCTLESILDFELIQVTTSKWDRVLRGALTLAKLRSFWSQLGAYFKEVKKIGRAVPGSTLESFLDFDFPPTISKWERVVRGVLTHAKLKSFFGVLGHYLRDVKKRADAVN